MHSVAVDGNCSPRKRAFSRGMSEDESLRSIITEVSEEEEKQILVAKLKLTLTDTTFKTVKHWQILRLSYSNPQNKTGLVTAVFLTRSASLQCYFSISLFVSMLCLFLYMYLFVCGAKFGVCLCFNQTESSSRRLTRSESRTGTLKRRTDSQVSQDWQPPHL